MRLSVGSWNTTWMRARSGLRTKRACDTSVMSRPESAIVPLVGSDESSKQAHHCGLAAAKFADEANAFAGSDDKIHLIDGMEARPPRASLHRIELGELRRLEQRRRRRHSGNLQRTTWSGPHCSHGSGGSSQIG